LENTRIFKVQRESPLDNEAIAETISLRHRAGEPRDQLGSTPPSNNITKIFKPFVRDTLIKRRLAP